MSDEGVIALLLGWETDRRPLHVRALEGWHKQGPKRRVSRMVPLSPEDAYKVTYGPYDKRRARSRRAS